MSCLLLLAAVTLRCPMPATNVENLNPWPHHRRCMQLYGTEYCAVEVIHFPERQHTNVTCGIPKQEAEE